MPPDNFYLTAAGKETAALCELRLCGKGQKFSLFAPGVISGANIAAAGRAPLLAFSRQALLECEGFKAESISAWGKLLGEKIIEKLHAEEGPWRLHFVGLGKEDLHRRGLLIADALKEFLQRKQRRLVRTLVKEDALPLGKSESLVQVGLEAKESGFLSVQKLSADENEHLLSRFARGEFFVEDDKFPPSRAYRKLVEAEARLGRPIKKGETCVDLGASPGGWSAIALQRGAKVLAVDRSPLREDLMQDANLKFAKGDGFSYKPDAAVDWLVCDIIAFPERSFELLQNWLTEGLCKNFCVTLKFRGEADFEIIERTKKLLGNFRGRYFLKQLSNNRNEITAAGCSS
jgi:23S rRNA (cytidine2498-2'-O)-methyltransferase